MPTNCLIIVCANVQMLMIRIINIFYENTKKSYDAHERDKNIHVEKSYDSSTKFYWLLTPPSEWMHLNDHNFEILQIKLINNAIKVNIN